MSIERTSTDVTKEIYEDPETPGLLPKGSFFRTDKDVSWNFIEPIKDEHDIQIGVRLIGTKTEPKS